MCRQWKRTSWVSRHAQAQEMPETPEIQYGRHAVLSSQWDEFCPLRPSVLPNGLSQPLEANDRMKYFKNQEFVCSLTDCFLWVYLE